MSKGIKTSEFWLSVLAWLLAGLGLIFDAVGYTGGMASLVGLGAAGLASAGYSWSRGKVKEAEARKDAAALVAGAATAASAGQPENPPTR